MPWAVYSICHQKAEGSADMHVWAQSLRVCMRASAHGATGGGLNCEGYGQVNATVYFHVWVHMSSYIHLRTHTHIYIRAGFSWLPFQCVFSFVGFVVAARFRGQWQGSLLRQGPARCLLKQIDLVPRGPFRYEDCPRSFFPTPPNSGHT